MLKRFPRHLYLAVTDFGFYTEIFQQSFQRTLTFLLFLSATAAVLLVAIYGWLYLPEVNRFFDWAENNLPAFRVSSGEMRLLEGGPAPAQDPIVLTYSNSVKWTLIFDEARAYEDNPVGLQEPAVLFSRENFFLRMAGQTQTYEWKDFGEFTIVPEELDSYRRLLKWLYLPLGYSFFLLYNLLAKGIQALLLSPLAYSVGLSYGVRLPFRSVYAIGLYSLVPAITIDLAVKMTGMDISYFDLIYIATAAIYTFFATQRCAVAH